MRWAIVDLQNKKLDGSFGIFTATIYKDRNKFDDSNIVF